jgi:hypothetical protein
VVDAERPDSHGADYKIPRNFKHLRFLKSPDMGPIDVFLHLLSFAAPAFALATLLALAGPLLLRRPRPLVAWWVQLALNSAVGVAVLALGLWHFGVDGKMATYAALVLAVAATQWAGSGGWRT